MALIWYASGMRPACIRRVSGMYPACVPRGGTLYSLYYGGLPPIGSLFVPDWFLIRFLFVPDYSFQICYDAFRILSVVSVSFCYIRLYAFRLLYPDCRILCYERYMLKKLRSTFAPSGVSTDSGWNCTPYTGYSMWATAISSPSSVLATGLRHSGRVSGSATRE